MLGFKILLISNKQRIVLLLYASNNSMDKMNSRTSVANKPFICISNEQRWASTDFFEYEYTLIEN